MRERRGRSKRRGGRQARVKESVPSNIEGFGGSATKLPHRFPFVEDLDEYEKEEDVGPRGRSHGRGAANRHGTMAKAVVVH